MRGRLTLEKVNAAINDMATYAEANAHIIAAPKKKVLFSSLFLILRHVFNLRPILIYYLSHEAGRKSLGKIPGK
jgi:hypothetical protein